MRRSSAMWRASISCLAVFLIVTPASARHHHRHGHRHHHTSALETRVPAAETVPERPPGQRIDENKSAATRIPIPPGWTEQSAELSTGGKRLVSPQGRAWVETYSSDVSAEPIPVHMRAFVFKDGETPTFIHGESDRIEVAGIKGDRRFYRKAIVACAGRVWHQIAFEYPVDMSRHIEPLLKSASSAVDASENAGCGNDAEASAPARSGSSATSGSAPAR